MTPDDDRPEGLRAQLDRELAGVTSRPGALGDVLRQARTSRRRVPWWRRYAGGVPVWVVTAASVLVVALAVPLLSGTLLGRPATPDRLAGAAGGPLREPVSSSAALPGPAATVPATPVPTRSSATPRPSASRRASAPPSSRPVVPPPASAPETSVPAPAACGPATAAAPPDGPAGTTVSVDVDGDGVPDRVALAGQTLSVSLTRRAGTVGTPFTTASPTVAVLPVETDGTPGAELLVITRGGIGNDGSVGRQAELFDVAGCTLGPVRNAQGKPYVFEIGSSSGDTARAGVACDGGVLLGVTSVRGATGWAVTRTPVSSASGTARNGTPSTATVPLGDPGEAALESASCGAALPQELG